MNHRLATFTTKQLIFAFSLSLGLLGFSLNCQAGGGRDEIQKRVLTQGELAPLPEAQTLLIEIASVIDSVELKTAIQHSRSLQLMREAVKASLFHLNFRFEVASQDYPYDPPFKEPFPFRPTLEAMDEAASFLRIVQETASFKAEVIEKIQNFGAFNDLPVLFSGKESQGKVVGLKKAEAISQPVDAYVIFQDRLEKFGENASFPEFEEPVVNVLKELGSEEILILTSLS